MKESKEKEGKIRIDLTDEAYFLTTPEQSVLESPLLERVRGA
jgi:hypothetical protein